LATTAVDPECLRLSIIVVWRARVSVYVLTEFKAISHPIEAFGESDLFYKKNTATAITAITTSARKVGVFGF